VKKCFSRFFTYLKSNKKTVSVLFSVCVAVLGGGYILAHLLGVFSEKLNITPATIATEELYEVADAYIFRDEHIVNTDYSGYRLDLVSDGELVGIGTEYARVYAEPIDGALELELREIDRVTALYSKCLVYLAPSGVNRYQEKKSELYKSITDALSRGQLASVTESRDDIIEIYSTLSLYLGKEDGEVKENLSKLAENMIGVDWNTGADSCRDMQMMSLCDHMIMANSTFSWWAAWLGRHPEKIVVAPERWNLEYDNDTNIYDPSWHKIPR
jgi:hypothetical protein